MTPDGALRSPLYRSRKRSTETRPAAVRNFRFGGFPVPALVLGQSLEGALLVAATRRPPRMPSPVGPVSGHRLRFLTPLTYLLPPCPGNRSLGLHRAPPLLCSSSPPSLVFPSFHPHRRLICSSPFLSLCITFFSFFVQSSLFESCLSLLQGPRTTFIKLRCCLHSLHTVLTPFQTTTKRQTRPFRKRPRSCPLLAARFSQRDPSSPHRTRFACPLDTKEPSNHLTAKFYTQRPPAISNMDSPDIKLDPMEATFEDHNDLDLDDSVQSTPSPNENQGTDTTPATSSSSHGPTSAPRRPPRKSTLTQQQKNQKRQRATQDQLVTLEMEFSKNATPTAATRERIASEINMTERSVQIWFQNRYVAS